MNPLPITSWAVLGLLSFGRELSGYDLKKWADQSLGFFYWSPSYSQIYSELRRLESCGYTASEEVAGDIRAKRLYRITPAGEDALRAWARETPVEPVVLKHGPMLRLWLGHLQESERLRELLVAQRAAAEKRRAEAEADVAAAAGTPEWTFPALTLRWAVRYYTDERDRIDAMLADLAHITQPPSDH
ncbi:PadR family transcriptional regulator [Streptacidiphilus rugosus]|uniref:PadR family transcriptional regulator n=1 Tax=Streptacidiphilus rugosus TaxID=405783 RepID=UPI0005654A01|nr:PadR family transcriptional regulator [Streptacidiphilus rugosus]